jgi:hypothetical protein
VLQGTYLPNSAHVRYLYDYKHQQIIILQRDDDNPKGLCTVQQLSLNDPFVKEQDQKLVPAQHFLDLNPTSVYKTRQESMFPDVRCALPRHATVRGPCSVP